MSTFQVHLVAGLSRNRYVLPREGRKQGGLQPMGNTTCTHYVYGRFTTHPLTLQTTRVFIASSLILVPPPRLHATETAVSRHLDAVAGDRMRLSCGMFVAAPLYPLSITVPPVPSHLSAAGPT